VKRLALALLLLAVGGASAHPQAQSGRTIVDRNHDNRLEYGPAEPIQVRTDLAQRGSGGTARQLIYFAQMTDTQLLDEESPARVELIDRIGPPYESAYRPQEGLLPMVLAEEVRAVRALRPELVMVTGDNTDNTQRNETRWFIDILDGGVVKPDSGAPRRCLAQRGKFRNVRGSRRYYEPDRSSGQDGPGYSPSARRNLRAVHRSNAVRDYPGIFEEMNRPFRSGGLGAPWYSVVGNHDALVQGNVPANAFFNQVATGCVKVTDLSRRAWNVIDPLTEGGVTDEENALIIQAIYGDVLATISNPTKKRSLWKWVAGDRERTLLAKKVFMGEHTHTRGRPTGHGFASANLESGEGNYSFSPKPGLRFVVLDTVAAVGNDGNLDHQQFLWLHAQLAAAETAHELVMVFAHHSLPSMGQRENNTHYGLTGSCPSTLPQIPPAPDESVRCLLLRHHSVIALVAGHSHRNRITPYARTGGGFWEIVTSSHADWPQQSRTISLVDNGDGTLTLTTKVVEQSSPPRPGKRVRSRGRLLAPKEVTRLASIARELAFNDPQAENGEDGFADRRGTPLDRNVELLVPSPY
jgi:metallophosphoesterase (TIGR03767 family)